MIADLRRSVINSSVLPSNPEDHSHHGNRIGLDNQPEISSGVDNILVGNSRRAQVEGGRDLPVRITMVVLRLREEKDLARLAPRRVEEEDPCNQGIVLPRIRIKLVYLRQQQRQIALAPM
jgi:hypothetical protein